MERRSSVIKRPLQALLAAGAVIAIAAIWLAGQYVSDSDRLVVITTLTIVVIFVFGMIASAASGRRRSSSSRRGKRAI
ncbi:MAG TPA: hypothetical protein VFB37_08935 [Steroidobacteraceae bacterium]|nr:hypothetical protein [Steroidobacteraceae bacterium]